MIKSVFYNLKIIIKHIIAFLSLLMSCITEDEIHSESKTLCMQWNWSRCKGTKSVQVACDICNGDKLKLINVLLAFFIFYFFTC